MASLYTSAVTVQHAIADGYTALFGDRFSSSYARLDELVPGMAPARVQEIFGDPIVRRPLQHADAGPPSLSGYSEWIYSEDGFFLQVIVSADDVVAGYAIQLKDGGFAPRLAQSTICGDQSNCKALRLGEATFAQLNMHDYRHGSGMNYGEAEMQYFESYVLGHAGVYQNVLLMATNAGSGSPNARSAYTELIQSFLSYKDPAPRNVDIGSLRTSVKPNVVLIVDGPYTDLFDLMIRTWHIGVGHLEVLRLDNPCRNRDNAIPGC
jgi:hypothetical protein